MKERRLLKIEWLLVLIVFLLFLTTIFFFVFLRPKGSVYQRPEAGFGEIKVSNIDQEDFLRSFTVFFKDQEKIDTLEMIKYSAAINNDCDNFYEASKLLSKAYLRGFRRDESLNELVNLLIYVQKNCDRKDLSEIDFLIIQSLIENYNPSPFEKEWALNLAKFHYKRASNQSEETAYYRQALEAIYDVYVLINYDTACLYLELMAEDIEEFKYYKEKGLLERRYKNHEKEYEFLKKAVALNSPRGGIEEYGVALRNVGRCEEAYDILNLDSTMLRRNKFYHDSARYILIPLINMGKWHTSCGDKNIGREYMERAMELAIEFKSSYHIEEILEHFKLHFVGKSNELIQYADYLDRYFENERIQEAFLKNLLFSADSFERKSTRQSKFIRYLFVLIGFLGIVGIYLIRRAGTNQKKKRLLELRAMELENQIAKQKLAFNTKEEFLSNGLKKLSSQLKKTKTSDQGMAKRLMEFYKITSELNDEIKGQENFYRIIESWNPSFFSKLLALNSNLTSLDLKHCSFIMLNLSNMEVAKILSVATESVNMHRYRLKQKLNIPENQSILSFLYDMYEEA